MINVNDILNKSLTDTLVKKRIESPRHVNRISDMGHPCARYLVYARTHWQSRAPESPALLGIFQTGSLLESQIIKILIDVGENSEPPFRIVGTQVVTSDKMLADYQIHGTIDGFLMVKIDNQWVMLGVIDIKTCSPHVFASINSYEDLQKYEWTKKYPAQLMLYSLAHNVDKCYILFVNKSNLYDMKIIEFDLDFAYAESLLAKAKVVNDAVAGKTDLPAKINNPSVCLKCPFEHICMPEVKTGEGYRLIDDDEIIELIEARNNLSDSYKEYMRIDNQLKNRLVKGQDIICGDTIIRWGLVNKKAYFVPAISYYQMKIINTKMENEDA